MFSPELLRALYRHMEWADARMWASVPKNGPPDPFLRERILHIHTVQRAFLHIWTRRPVQEVFRTPDQFAAMAELCAWAHPYYAEVGEFLNGVTDARLTETIVMPWASELSHSLGRAPGRTTLGDTCFQVTSHTTHHRGQINTRLRELGVEPPLVDYIAWLWFEKPAPAWQPS